MRAGAREEGPRRPRGPSPPSPPDLLFHCNAGPGVGFGHLRRCLSLSRELRDRRSDFRIALGGDLSPEARELVDRSPRVEWAGPGPPSEHARVAVIDCMFDVHDLDRYDAETIRRIAGACGVTVLLSSSLRPPPASLPVDVVVGHLLADERGPDRRTYGGLHLAPIPSGVHRWVRDAPVASTVRRMFVGFGGWGDPTGLVALFRSLGASGFDGEIDCLLSPVHLDARDRLRELADLPRLTFHTDVPEVAPILAQADLAWTTYGHLTFEALALGVPVACAGIKEFQVEYATALEREGLLLSLGRAEVLERSAVADVLARLDAPRRADLRATARAAIGGGGLHRVADILLDCWSRTADRGLPA